MLPFARYIGPYNSRLPPGLWRLARAVQHYVAHCRQATMARSCASLMLRTMSQNLEAGHNIDAIADNIAAQYRNDHIVFAVNKIAAMTTFGKLCADLLEAEHRDDGSRYFAPLVRRTVSSGLGLTLGLSNETLETRLLPLLTGVSTLTETAKLDPAVLDAWGGDQRGVLDGTLVGAEMSEDFLRQQIAGDRRPTPSDRVQELFSVHVMFAPSELPPDRSSLTGL